MDTTLKGLPGGHSFHFSGCIDTNYCYKISKTSIDTLFHKIVNMESFKSTWADCQPASHSIHYRHHLFRYNINNISIADGLHFQVHSSTLTLGYAAIFTCLMFAFPSFSRAAFVCRRTDFFLSSFLSFSFFFA